MLCDDVGEHWFVNFQNFAFALRDDRGAAFFAGEQRHFAEAIAWAQHGHLRQRAVVVHENFRLAPDENEHRSAVMSLLDYFFAATEALKMRAWQHHVEMRVVETVEHRQLADRSTGRRKKVRLGRRRAPFDLQRANWKWNFDSLPVKFIPDVRADRVGNLVEVRVVVHPELQLVFDGVVAEIF